MKKAKQPNDGNMAQKLGLGPEVKELKFGHSFTNNKASSFHTFKYDFKPASVDTRKVATVDVGDNQQVSVTLPHQDKAGTPQTIFKGSQKPYQKECVLIFDRATGEVILEKLSTNVQVKKTRMEKATPTAVKPIPSTSSVDSKSKNSQRKISVRNNKKIGFSKTHQMASSLSTLIPRHSPLHASPSHPSRSPTRPQHKSPTAASLPIIGLDDNIDGNFGNCSRYGNSTAISNNQDTRKSPEFEKPAMDIMQQRPVNPSLTESSSSSTGLSSESDSESEQRPVQNMPPKSNGWIDVPPVSAADLLDGDLQLSSTGSDSE